MIDQLEKFCKNYEVRIVNDTGRHVRHRPPTFFADPSCADLIRLDVVEHQTEKLYTVQIPEGRLHSLVDMENRVMNYRNDPAAVNMFELLMDKEREESYLRNTNAAVKKAYEQYSIMLNLAGYQRKI